MGIFTSEDRLYAAHARMRPGNYFTGLGCATGTVSLAQGVLRLQPVVVMESMPVDRMACEVTVLGEAGSVVRLGLFRSDPDTYEPLLAGPVVDAGTVATDGSTGMKEVTIAQVLSRGVWWMAGVPQSCPTTPPQMRSANQPGGFYPHSDPNNATMLFTNGCYEQTGATGALPSWSTDYAGASLGGTIKTWLRRAP